MLENLRVAKPCGADWNAMTGDERVRMCNLCSMNVYNLSAMTRAEAEAFVASREGRTCIQLYQREDGTVITQDCPIGLAAVKRKVAKVVASTVGLLSLAGATFLGYGVIADFRRALAVQPLPDPAPRPYRAVKGEMIRR